MYRTIEAAPSLSTRIGDALSPVVGAFGVAALAVLAATFIPNIVRQDLFEKEAANALCWKTGGNPPIGQSVRISSNTVDPRLSGATIRAREVKEGHYIMSVRPEYAPSGTELYAKAGCN